MNAPLAVFAAVITVLSGVVWIEGARDMGGKYPMAAFIGWLLGLSSIVSGVTVIVLIVTEYRGVA